MVSEDELLILIAKGNEEAMRLLFSCYEKKMRFESEKLRKAYNIPIFDHEDIYQEMVIHFLNLLPFYDNTRATLYSFWISILNRDMNRMLMRKFGKGKDPRKSVDMDKITEASFTSSPMEEYEFHEDLRLYFHALKDEKRKDMYIGCLNLWAKGYSYDEIAEHYHISRTLVNSFIRRGLEKIRLKFHIKEKK